MFSLQVWVLFSMMVILNQAVIINLKRSPSKDINSRYSLNIISPKVGKSIQVGINITSSLSPSNKKKTCSKSKDGNKSPHEQAHILVHIHGHRHKHKNKHTHKHKHKHTHKHKHKHTHKHKHKHTHKHKHKHTHKHNKKHTHKHNKKHTHKHKHKKVIEPDEQEKPQGNLKPQGNIQLQLQKQPHGPRGWQPTYGGRWKPLPIFRWWKNYTGKFRRHHR